jgi:hypothetical protein
MSALSTKPTNQVPDLDSLQTEYDEARMSLGTFFSGNDTIDNQFSRLFVKPEAGLTDTVVINTSSLPNRSRYLQAFHEKHCQDGRRDNTTEEQFAKNYNQFIHDYVCRRAIAIQRYQEAIQASDQGRISASQLELRDLDDELIEIQKTNNGIQANQRVNQTKKPKSSPVTRLLKNFQGEIMVLAAAAIVATPFMIHEILESTQKRNNSLGEISMGEFSDALKHESGGGPYRIGSNDEFLTFKGIEFTAFRIPGSPYIYIDPTQINRDIPELYQPLVTQSTSGMNLALESNRCLVLDYDPSTIFGATVSCPTRTTTQEK